MKARTRQASMPPLELQANILPQFTLQSIGLILIFLYTTFALVLEDRAALVEDRGVIEERGPKTKLTQKAAAKILKANKITAASYNTCTTK
jgi:hypothetical protein